MSSQGERNIPLFKQFFYERVDFNELPDSPPYGFWVSSSEVIIARSMHDHFKEGLVYLRGKGKDTRDVYNAMFDLGFVRVVIPGSTLVIEYRPGTTPRSSIKTAEDIADFYSLDVLMHTELASKIGAG